MYSSLGLPQWAEENPLSHSKIHLSHEWFLNIHHKAPELKAWEVCTGTSFLHRLEQKQSTNCVLLELSSVCALPSGRSGHFHVHTVARIHRKQGEATIPLTTYSPTVDILCWSCLSHPKKGQTPFHSGESRQMIAFCFHLCLALFISSPLFCFDHESWLFLQ